MLDAKTLFNELKFHKETNIQLELIKKINYKEPVLVCVSKTGTGKTHAYLIPLFCSLVNENNTFMILLPTNELVMQVTKMIKELISIVEKLNYNRHIDCLSIVSGIDYNDLKLKILKTNYDIIVATPAKIRYLMDQNIKIRRFDRVVIDEADMMFEVEFMEMIISALDYVKPIKTLLVSATITKNMNSFIGRTFGSYRIIDVTKEDNLDIEYRLYPVPKHQREEKLLFLTKLLSPLLCLLFVSKTSNAEKIYSYLKDHEINVCYYSAKLSINGRKNLFAEIKRGKYQYIVTSDIMSRGIDFDVSDVINYDFPNKSEYLLHRFGRTGRMNKKGIVHIICANDSSEQVQINRLKNANIPLVEYKLEENVISKVVRKKTANQELINEIKKIPKPNKVTPNYKKKNKAQIKKIKQDLIKKKAKAEFKTQRKQNL